jgi:hypothetical protein
MSFCITNSFIKSSMKKKLLVVSVSVLFSIFCYGQSLNLPVDFENTTPSYYGLTDFGGNASEIIVDAANPDNHVVKTIKTAVAELWAGTTVGGTVGFATPIPFAPGSTSISVRVWSPTAGTRIRLKVEDANDPTISVETEANTTLANSWETLVFNFNNQALGTAVINFAYSYNKASIFFNFGATGAQAGEHTYYWDDMYFGVYSGIDLMNQSNNRFTVYPNPAIDYLYFNSNQGFAKAVIFNEAGVQVLEQFNVSNSLCVSALNAGVYFIILTNANGRMLTSKFLKY